jgi:hypothetical protein
MTTTLTATVQPTFGRVLLNLTWTGITSATISRIHADGTVWPLRDAAPIALTSSAATVFDNEPPLDQAVTYKATSTQTGVTFSSSPATVPSDPSWVGSVIWLTHPTSPSLSMLLPVTEIGAQTRAGRTGILQILGSPLPIAISDVRVLAGASLTAHTTTDADADALRALLADGSTLLMRPPGSWSTPWQYVAFGDVAEVNASGIGPDVDTTWTMPYTVVAPPAGQSLGAVGSTWADAIAAYATWADEISGEATWADLIAHPGP